MVRVKMIPRNKPLILIMALIAAGLILYIAGRVSGKVPEGLPARGAIIPAFSIPAPPNQADRSYLTLSAENRFEPAKLKVDLVLIEVFNIYCASCQYMRPYMNELYAKIEQDPELKDRVKMIGIAVGNDHWNVALEEGSYDFPIVPDNKLEFHGIVGQPPTPFLIFARPYTGDRLLVLNSHLGRLEDSDELLAMTRAAFKTDISKIDISPDEQSYRKGEAELIIPISEDELMKRVRNSLSEKDGELTEIKKITLPELGQIYTGTLMNSQKRVFARVVARKIPCVDCHDVFFIYSFNSDGEFMRFIPISISKLDNEEWNEDDVDKIRKSFDKRSLLEKITFNTEIDAVTSATISTKLIYDSIGETNQVIEKLKDLGYISTKK